MESFTHLCLSYCKVMKTNSCGKFCGGGGGGWGSKQIFAKSEDTAFVTPPIFLDSCELCKISTMKIGKKIKSKPKLSLVNTFLCSVLA